VQVLPLMSGVQRVMLDIFRALEQREFELHVACCEEGPLTDELSRQGIHWHVVPALGRSIRPRRDLAAYRQLRELFKKWRFDVVHTHSSKPGVLGRLAASHAGVPAIIHHVQGFSFHEFSSKASRLFGIAAERWAGRHCHRVIFANHEERIESIRQGWLPEEKCLTIYNGVDLDEFQPAASADERSKARARFSLAKDEVGVFVLGRLDPQKQPLILPPIAARLEMMLPRAAWRILVAGDGALQPQLIDDLRRHGMEHRVTLLNWQTDRTAVMHAADIVLHPTLWEGLPLSLVEAQASGLPTVASDVKGNREVVTSDTGMLCSPRDADAYARALAGLIVSPEARTTLGQAARVRAKLFFDAATNYQQVAALYCHLLGRPAPALPQRKAA
jgi:glycosyltransferase involved in cell wall biosynthesis